MSAPTRKCPGCLTGNQWEKADYLDQCQLTRIPALTWECDTCGRSDTRRIEGAMWEAYPSARRAI